MSYDEVRSPGTGLTAWRASGEGLRPVLPDAEADLMWWRDGLWIAGTDTVAHVFEGGGGGPTYGVRLPAGTIPAVLRDSAAVAVDQRVELARVLDAATVSRLSEAVASSPDRRRALSAVVAQLLQDAPVDRHTTEVSEMVVRASALGTPVAEIADRLGWSPRRLHRFSLATFGVPVVVLRQLLRFRRARRLLARGTAPVEVAAIAGYSDQAHLTREVVRFAGVTPSRLHDA